jgi:hypothetical protein
VRAAGLISEVIRAAPGAVVLHSNASEDHAQSRQRPSSEKQLNAREELNLMPTIQLPTTKCAPRFLPNADWPRAPGCTCEAPPAIFLLPIGLAKIIARPPVLPAGVARMELGDFRPAPDRPS